MLEVINKKVVVIEYPRQNEAITSNNYTFSIVAMPGVKKVEVSIDGSAWEPCRQSDSWWYDWSGYGAGEHEVTARIQLANGHFHTTEPRFFSVEFKYDGLIQNGGERRTLSPRRAQQLLGRPELHKHMVSKFVVVVPNQPGILRQLTQLLSKEGVNVDSLLAETFGDVASFRFLLEKENDLRRTLEREGFHVVEDKVFRLDLPNRPGELDQLTRKLAEQGVAIRYMYGTSYGRMSKIILAVDRPEDALGVVKELDQSFIAVEA
jgi:hypothetical protein